MKTRWMVLWLITMNFFWMRTASECVGESTGILLPIRLPSNITLNTIQYYNELILHANTTNRLQLQGINRSTKQQSLYIMLQVHAYRNNITITYKATSKNATRINTETGQNLGFILTHDTVVQLHTCNATTQNTTTTNVSVIVLAYSNDAPVPGGCNMEYGGAEISPIMFVSAVSDGVLWQVDTPNASVDGGAANACGKHNLTYDFYYRYLEKFDYSMRMYFDGIKSMVEINSVEIVGNHNRKAPPGPQYRRLYMVPPGTGIVFSTVVRNENGASAAYVPAFAIDCDPEDADKSCYYYDVGALQITAILLLLAGGLKMVIGNILPFISAFIDALILGAFTTYLIFAGINGDEGISTTRISMVVGALLMATAWSITCFLVPQLLVLIDSLSTILVGFLLGCFIYFMISIYCETCILGGTILIVYFLAMILIFLLVPPCLMWRSIIMNAVLGSYLIAFVVQWYVGSFLTYVVINGVRLLIVDDYDYAMIKPLIEYTDLIYLVMWIILLVVGIFVQHNIKMVLINRERRRIINERTPLITRWTSQSDDVFESPNTNSKFLKSLVVPPRRR